MSHVLVSPPPCPLPPGALRGVSWVELELTPHGLAVVTVGPVSGRRGVGVMTAADAPAGRGRGEGGTGRRWLARWRRAPGTRDVRGAARPPPPCGFAGRGGAVQAAAARPQAWARARGCKRGRGGAAYRAGQAPQLRAPP
jgi:hypothetical protein